MEPTKERLDEIQKRLYAALDMVSDLCHGIKRWTMSIPAKPESDPDLVIASALKDANDLLEQVRALQEENERLSEALKNILLNENPMDFYDDADARVMIRIARAALEKVELKR